MATQPNKRQVLAVIRKVNGIGPKLSASIWKKYGNRTAEILISDPAKVAEEIRGISLQRAEAARAYLLADARELQLEREEFAAESLSPMGPDLAEAIASEVSDTDAGMFSGLINKDKVRVELRRRWDETYQQRRHAEEVLQRNFESLLKLPNVSGAHVGFRRRRNAQGEEMICGDLETCIRVHVNHKFPPQSAAFSDYRLAMEIPAEIEGVPTDVTERSYVTLDLPKLSDRDVLPSADVGRFEEVLVGGIEIARQGSPLNGGTLGGIVFANQQPRMITNQHVAGVLASRVNQPADGVVPTGFEAEIGWVVDSEMPAAGGIGSIDCAIIALKPDGRDATQSIKGLGPPFRLGSAKLTPPDVHRTTAIKVGAETNRTEGIVKSVSTIVNVNGAMMPNQIIVECEDGSEIIRGGDSGSLLLVKAADNSVFNIVGLVHARSRDNQAMVATHFDEIETRFGVKSTFLD